MRSEVEIIDHLFLHIEFHVVHVSWFLWWIFPKINRLVPFFTYMLCYDQWLLTYCVLPPFFFSFSFFAELENRLLSRFDAASQRRELSTMAECAKILSQVIFVSILMYPTSYHFGLLLNSSHCPTFMLCTFLFCFFVFLLLLTMFIIVTIAC